MIAVCGCAIWSLGNQICNSTHRPCGERARYDFATMSQREINWCGCAREILERPDERERATWDDGSARRSRVRRPCDPAATRALPRRPAPAPWSRPVPDATNLSRPVEDERNGSRTCGPGPSASPLQHCVCGQLFAAARRTCDETFRSDDLAGRAPGSGARRTARGVLSPGHHEGQPDLDRDGSLGVCHDPPTR